MKKFLDEYGSALLLALILVVFVVFFTSIFYPTVKNDIVSWYSNINDKFTNSISSELDVNGNSDAKKTHTISYKFYTVTAIDESYAEYENLWSNPSSNPTSYKENSGFINISKATPTQYTTLCGYLGIYDLDSSCSWKLNGEEISQLDTNSLKGDIELVYTCSAG